MSEASSSLHDELQPLLTARIRVGALLVGLSILLYGVLELWQQRAPLPSFFAVKVIQVVAIVVVWLALDRAGSWRRTVLLALALVAEVCVTLAISGILAREVASAPLLYVLVTLGTATLIPWGLGPQAATVAVAAASLLANAAWVPPPDGFGYTVTAAVLAFLASLAVAHELDAQRTQRRQAEDEERASASALRDEIAIAEATTHAARELLAAGDTTRVVATLCRLETRLLGCEASYTFLRDAHDAKSFAVVASDGDSTAELTSRRALRIPDISLARVIDRLDKDEPVVVTGTRDVLPVDGAVCVYTALMAGHDVTGIQVAVRRDARGFTPAEVELARRLTHTASAALSQARLAEAGAMRHASASGVGGRVWNELQTPLSSILRLAEHAGDVSLPPAERRALVVRIASTARDVLRMLERLEQGDPGTSRDGKTAQG